MTSGRIILFGSGEMSPTGRKIHEDIIKESRLPTPLRIGILETPTGFEVNALHGWPERMQKFFEKGLRNYHPIVTRIHALRRDGQLSTNNPAIVDTILSQDYLYCGAGSPGYAIKHLRNTKAYQHIVSVHKNGKVLCLGSATAVAMSAFAIPVYEIFKSGVDPHWILGLDIFKRYGLHLAIVPHWNNTEGENFDTTRCYLGIDRFSKLSAMLPHHVVILGIDEITACVFDPLRREFNVMGVGSAHVIDHGVYEDFVSGKTFSIPL